MAPRVKADTGVALNGRIQFDFDVIRADGLTAEAAALPGAAAAPDA